MPMQRPSESDGSQSGFTIVEVMIVLAIAGLVLAIVFIAVPALQRNARNTQRRADLGNLRAQFNTWTANNGGKLPGATSVTNGFNSIIKGTAWGHYNGNDPLPTPFISNRATSSGVCTAGTPAETPLPTDQTDCENGADEDITTTGDAGTWTPTISLAQSRQVGEYRVGYASNVSNTDLATMEYPGRQEIHIFGEMECVVDILAGGNDIDTRTGTPATYAASYADVKDSHARAVAYVYQMEGEDNARCEDNV